jgi:hypothetical protein
MEWAVARPPSQRLPQDLFERLPARLADWLEDEPDWALEEDYFAPWFRQHVGALEYFNDLGFSRGALKELGVRIVEGEHPGSTYYVAELRLPIDEANRRARELGIPVLFVEHEEPQRSTTAEEGA